MEEEPNEYNAALWRVILLLAFALGVALILAACTNAVVDYTDKHGTKIRLHGNGMPWPPNTGPPDTFLLPPLLQMSDETTVPPIPEDH